ncbi:MAG TPA: SRPBCC family protein [Myxococcaceae bacterium]|nr:SRPBCC family protein [Myxococcaceae bacterium]
MQKPKSPLKAALLVILALVVVAVVVGFFLPSQFAVSRSEQVNAPPEAIYPFVASPKKWADWSAWNPKVKPEFAFSYEGPDAGPGARLRLSDGKGGRGSGTLTIAEGDPKKGIHYVVELENGFQIHGSIELEATATGTKVTWTDRGEMSNPMMRYFIFTMDRMLGGAFEQGLKDLKKQVESPPAAPAQAPAAPATAAPATP